MTIPRLLVVDDEIDFAKLVSRVATSIGFDVEVTTRGKQFMLAVEHAEPNVIVLDMVMPAIDGIELIKWLAVRKSVARIILVTGFHPHSAKIAEILGTAGGLLSITTLLKPVTVADLKAALQGE